MMIFTMFSALKRRWKNERGAVLVEAALAVPILMFVILGAVEAGMAWEAKSATTSGVRTGLLRAASIGDKPETDLRILQSIIGEIGADNVDQLDWVVVFDASGANNAATIETCRLAEAGGGVAGLCNTYGSGTQFADVVAGTITLASHFDDGGNGITGGYNCDNSKIDSNWCAPGRLVNGDVEIGLALKYRHTWFTGILPGDGVDFEDYSTSSTFIGDGSDISASNPVMIDTLAYDSGSFNGALNVGDVTWSASANVTSAPANSFRNFLGLYAAFDSVQLNVGNLATHTQVCVTFDLLVIGNWDYAADLNNPVNPEDVFSLGIDGTNVHKSSYNDGNPPAGSTEIDTLGYTGDLANDWVVTITECVPHTGSTADFDFSSAMSAGATNEAWGIDNVVVTVS